MGVTPAVHKTSARVLLERYRRDPVAWGREVLGVRFTRQQREALADFVKNMKVNGGTGKMLIKSGYGTGKTWLAAFIGIWFVCVFSESTVLFMSSSGPHVKEKLFAEFRRMYLKSRVRLGGDLQTMSLRFGDKWKANAVSPANPDNFQGSHATNLLIVFDEAQAVTPEFWDAADGMMQGSGACMIGIFNPLYTDGKAAENWKRATEWKRVTFSSLDHENVLSKTEIFPGAVTHGWVEARRRAWGEASPLWRTRVLGEFPNTSENTLVSLYDLETAEKEGRRSPDGLWLGVDIGRMGSDPSVASLVGDRKLIHVRDWFHEDTMASVGRIRQLQHDYEIPWDHINIDVCGLGVGVYDRLIEDNKPVNAVDFGGGATGDWENFEPMQALEFVNRRAELHWAVRELIRHKGLIIPVKYEMTWSDLSAIRFKFRSDGAIQIEAKEDFHKRLGRSPDFGDSLVYAMARESSAPTAIFH